LQFFIQNENRLLRTDEIYESVWGRPMAGNSRALVTAINRLRLKLVGCGYTISSEYGKGYYFERG
jgi:DNA-binding response OmpR family regulator